MSEPTNREVAVLNAALELRPAEQAAYLDEACAGDAALRQQVEDLIRADAAAEGFLEAPPGSLGLTRTVRVTVPLTEKAGDRIGHYKLLQQIGEGGCGVVYMAEQEEPVRRRVALKVIKLGMDTKQVVARFDAERQALALMDHPNIAKVLEAGATETGRPYFVMELVRGVKITDFCDENKLSTQERLKLFIQVCQAIQHAHQKGIIHRDIKPSNILVTVNDGVPVPKVIDFGIAKATQGRLTDQTLFTAFEQFIGTPAYMSPEQAVMTSLDIDTRSDIYSLGVLLYELLTGKTPFDQQELLAAGLDEMRRTIREKEPPRPSTRLSAMAADALTTTAKRCHTDAPKLLHAVQGDLDWIVMKCLEKDRARRYETANGVATDILRHLNCEPVVARPPSRLYEFQKTVRRHKLGFAAAAGLITVLAVGVVVSTWQAVRATRAESLASQRLVESEAISKFLTEVFESPDPARDGRTVTVAETLGAATRKLETDLTKQPARQANLQATLGATYFALGLYREAIQLQEKVRDYYLAIYGLQDTNTLKALQYLAISYDNAGRSVEALKLREEVLALRRKVNGPDHPATLGATANLADSYDTAGRHEELIRLREQVLESRRKVLGPEHPGTIDAVDLLANAYAQAGRRDETVKFREQEFALQRKVLGQGNPGTLHAMVLLANAYDLAGRHDDAFKLREEMLALHETVLGHASTDSPGTMMALADAYYAVGRSKEAIALLAQACELNSADTVASLRLATWQTWFGQDAAYEATRHRLIQLAEGTDEAGTADRDAKAACLRPSNDAVLLTKAINLAQRAVGIGKRDWALPWFELGLGLAEYRNGQYAAAQQALTIAEQTASGNPVFPVGIQQQILGTALLYRAMSLFRQGKLEEARKLFSQAEAQVPPFPKDESKPSVDGGPASHDDLICWLAYKEAKALIEGQPESATEKKPEAH